MVLVPKTYKQLFSLCSFACPEWQAGPWSACSEKCGDAFQYRSVTCRSEKEGEEGKLLAADACPADEQEKFDTERTCNLGPCEGLTFVTGEWNLVRFCKIWGPGEKHTK